MYRILPSAASGNNKEKKTTSSFRPDVVKPLTSSSGGGGGGSSSRTPLGKSKTTNTNTKKTIYPRKDRPPLPRSPPGSPVPSSSEGGGGRRRKNRLIANKFSKNLFSGRSFSSSKVESDHGVRSVSPPPSPAGYETTDDGFDCTNSLVSSDNSRITTATGRTAPRNNLSFTHDSACFEGDDDWTAMTESTISSPGHHSAPAEEGDELTTFGLTGIGMGLGPSLLDRPSHNDPYLTPPRPPSRRGRSMATAAKAQMVTAARSPDNTANSCNRGASDAGTPVSSIGSFSRSRSSETTNAKHTAGEKHLDKNGSDSFEEDDGPWNMERFLSKFACGCTLENSDYM